MDVLDKIVVEIRALTRVSFRTARWHPIAGGSISQTAMLEAGSVRYFVKQNAADRLEMFEAEMAGLQALQTSGALRVPSPVGTGVAAGRSFLVLEYIEMREPSRRSEAALGRGLAQLHRTRQPRFGWHRDNTIGSTPQQNAYRDDWVAFFAEQRLAAQLELVRRRGYGDLSVKGERLLRHLGAFFRGHHCEASLLHGDLWSGNVGVTAHGEPVVFDPAVYFGDREADVAMTQLFGGFSQVFYAAYQEEWPLAPGYETRFLLYNLYHLLNHVNLFGGGYYRQTSAVMDTLLAEVGAR